MSEWIRKMNTELIRNLLGYDTHKNMRHAMIDALSDPEYCSWSVDDVKRLAEKCDEHWGIGLAEHCETVEQEWRKNAYNDALCDDEAEVIRRGEDL